MALLDQIKYQYRTGGVHIKLIFINISIYLFFTTIWILCDLMLWEESKDWLHNQFAFYSEPTEFIKHIWGVFTYMFVHALRPVVGFWHLLFNMAFLYFSGRIFEDLLGSKKLLSIYIIGGVFGALFQITSVNIFPKFFLVYEENVKPLVGASASVAAIITAIGLYSPNYEVYLFRTLKVKLIYIAIFFVLFEYIKLSNIDGVSHFAHFGGAIWGFVFVNNIKKGKDISNWFENILTKISGLTRKKKIKIVYKKKKAEKKSSAPNSKSRQEKVDDILDKIKLSGYESLTKEEKDYLFDASKHI